MKTRVTLRPFGGVPVEAEVELQPGGEFSARVAGAPFEGRVDRLSGCEGTLRLEERAIPFVAVRVGAELHLWLGGQVFRFALETPADPARTPGSRALPSGEVRAPMPGRVTQVLVQAGTEVSAGALLAVLESMKVQFNVTAPAAGRVAEVRCRPGQMVELDAALFRLEPDATLGHEASV